MGEGFLFLAPPSLEEGKGWAGPPSIATLLASVNEGPGVRDGGVRQVVRLLPRSAIDKACSTHPPEQL